MGGREAGGELGWGGGGVVGGGDVGVGVGMGMGIVVSGFLVWVLWYLGLWYVFFWAIWKVDNSV